MFCICCGERSGRYGLPVLSNVVAEKAYTNPKLKFTDLPKRLQTNNGQLSRIINTGFGQNVNDFINRHRVKEVELRPQSEEAAQLTFMSTAYNAASTARECLTGV